MASEDKLAQQVAERDRQRMAFLRKVYELSHADPEKDVPYHDIVAALEMDDDACRTAKLYLIGQALIHTAHKGGQVLVMHVGEAQHTIGSPSDLLRITPKGILRAERDLKKLPTPRPQTPSKGHG